MRLLAIDIGNSRIKCALFLETEIERTFEMASDRLASGASYRHALRSHVGELIPQRAAIASVVPELDERISDAVKREFMLLPEFIRVGDLDERLLEYHPPASLGADRLAAAIAGHLLYGGGERPIIVIDAGTAVTFEVVGSTGRYLGGAIWAGPQLVADALSQGTSLLPDISPALPKRLPATDTKSCIRAGILYGFLDGAAGILDRLQKEAGPTTYTVATGGYGAWLCERLDSIQAFDPMLVLNGIRLIVEGRLPTPE